MSESQLGGGQGGGQKSQRSHYQDRGEISRNNTLFEKYYNELGIIGNEEQGEFWDALRRDLPNSFRFTGSKGYVFPVVGHGSSN